MGIPLSISPARSAGILSSRWGPRCSYVAAREHWSRLGARTPACVTRHAAKLPWTSPLTESCRYRDLDLHWSPWG